MTNVISLNKSQGFTRMDNELYEALIGADLSGRELRVALAIHRLTAGYNVDEARIAASVIADISGIRREHVSRMICELLRQGVIYRVGGSKGPIGFAPVSEWKIDPKECAENGTKDLAQSAGNGTKVVPFSAHNKDNKDNTVPSELVDAAAPTSVEVAQPEQPDPKADRIPYAKIQDLYNRVCGHVLPQCLKLNDKRKGNIRKCWNLNLNGTFPFRSAEFWEGYFNDCLTNKHWTGNNESGWRADLEFLTREEKVLKVLEGA
jgi:phage replication O-like protein O